MLLTAPAVVFTKLEATRVDLAMRFADVDSMRVVHHAVYLHWFEKLRFDFMHSILGISMESMLQSKIHFPLTNCDAKYRYALSLRDRAHGLVRLTIHRNATFTFSYWIFTESRGNTPSVTGSTRHCYVDDNLSLLVAPPEPFKSAFLRAANAYPDCLFVEGQA